MKLISAFVFTTRLVQSLYFLNTKFHACSYVLRLHSTVCVRPGQNPKVLVLSRAGSSFAFGLVWLKLEIQANNFSVILSGGFVQT